jgi:hypothetical protein
VAPVIHRLVKQRATLLTPAPATPVSPPPPPPPPPAVFAVALDTAGARDAIINIRFTSAADRLYFVVVPNADATPSAAQVVAGTNAADGTPSWANNGKVYNVGVGQSIWMEGPNGLIPTTAYKLCGVQKDTDTTLSAVKTVSFTTIDAAPLVVAKTPSNGWKTASLSDSLTIQFSDPITFGTGNFTLYDTDTAATVETFNVANGTGSAGGTITRTTTVHTNDTVVINPNANLTARKNYSVRIASTCIKSASAAQSYAGFTNDTTWAFRAGYSAGNASTILAADTPGLAFDLTDNTCKIAGTGAYDSTFSGKFTITGSYAKSESGMLVNASNYARLLTSAFGYSNTVGTLIIYTLTDNGDSGQGTGSNINSVAGFDKHASTLPHYFSLVKSDTSTRNSRVGLVSRNNAGATEGVELADLSFPSYSTYAAIGMTWDGTEAIVATATEAATLTWASGGFGNALEFFLGYSTAPFDTRIKSGLYLPSKLSQAALQTRLSTFDDFRTA